MKYSFEVTSNIPLPNTGRVRHYAKYPFEVMKPGDSFFVENGRRPIVYQAAYKAAMRAGDRKFMVRNEFYRGVPGVRVWRTE